MGRAVHAWALLAFLGSAACGGSDLAADGPAREGARRDPLRSAPAPSASATHPSPRWPSSPSTFAPTMAATLEGPADVELLADVDTCAGCHADAAAQWSESAHSRSSFDNPFYRVAVDALRDEVGFEESRFCAGCHDPLLLFSGGIDAPVRPDDPLAHGGITCLLCHGIQEVRTDGNGSYTLDTSPVPLPRRDDPESLERHRARLRPPPLRTASLCGGCHRGFVDPEVGVPHFLPGLDELGPWRASPYAGAHATRVDLPVEERTCQGCHMEQERELLGDPAAREGTLHSHRFPGGQTALAASLPRQLEAVRGMLRRAATLDVLAFRGSGGTALSPVESSPLVMGETLHLDVVIGNEAAGHAFPGGVRDTQDTWVEVTIDDRSGRRLAEAGTAYEHGDDPTAHRLASAVLDENGQVELAHFVHRFRAVAYDQTVGPRDARVVRYELSVPDGLGESAYPLSVRARLRHRRHNRVMQEAACRSERAPRGRAFRRTVRRLGRSPIDPCADQPVTEIAEVRLWIGPGAEDQPAVAGRAPWQRSHAHALGLSHGVQEQLDDALSSVRRGLTQVSSGYEPLPQAQAMLYSLMGALYARQGRWQEALGAVDRAEELVGEHPALWRIRGRAHAQVWKWPQAAQAFSRVVRLTPGDSMAFSELARALGSAGDPSGALQAAVTGLALKPRDASLLRSQALALGHLDSRHTEHALSLFLAHRKPDDAPSLRARCAESVRSCARDRQPIPLILMR